MSEKKTLVDAQVLYGVQITGCRTMSGIDGLIYGITVIVVLAVLLTLRRRR